MAYILETESNLRNRVQTIWQGMCRGPFPSTSEENDKDNEDDHGDVTVHSQEIELTSKENDKDNEDDDDELTVYSVESEKIESSDVDVDCPLWADLPEDLVESLLKCAEGSRERFKLLDSKLLELLHLAIPSYKIAKTEPIEITLDILSRLPTSSPRLSTDEFSLFNRRNANSDEFTLQHSITGSVEVDSQGSNWESLEVTTILDSNTIRLALIVAYLDRTTHPLVAENIAAYVNVLASLLDSMLSFNPDPCLSERQRKELDKYLSAYQILRAFLWTAWQRSLLVCSYYVLGTRLRAEINDEYYNNLPFPDSNMTAELQFGPLGNSLRPERYMYLECDYMCRYSFELLKKGSVFATQDYRTLLARFKEHFGDRKPRCCAHNYGMWEQCDGKSWSSCGRFFGMKVEDQSAHDLSCTGLCMRKPWDEQSYRSVRGARAVSCSLTRENGPLKYCVASEQTLAISHVWSHGQGGNPENGFNSCLHNRYRAIANELGCNSYWIDAACIPLDTELRSAAINTINPIFKHSRVTLICDRDISTVDVTTQSAHQLEILASTLLLSDWNVRGWTLLEVVRGCNAVNLLCKDNRIVSLKKILSTLYQCGSIDLCALLIGSHHLMPPTSEPQIPGIEAAGVMLSMRYASRPGDEVIIWSLLSGDDRAYKRPAELWRSRVNTSIRTGFLMSSCDRVKNVKGLSWAPATPQADGPNTSRRPNDLIYVPYDGEGTTSARIMPPSRVRGTIYLRGSWLAYPFVLHEQAAATIPTIAGSCWERAEQLITLEGYLRVIFLRPLFLESMMAGWSQGNSRHFVAAQNIDIGSEDQRMPVAVCATREDHAQFIDPAYLEEWEGRYELEPEGWEWKGIYTCPEAGLSVPMQFKTREIRLI